MKIMDYKQFILLNEDEGIDVVFDVFFKDEDETFIEWEKEKYTASENAVIQKYLDENFERIEKEAWEVRQIELAEMRRDV